MKDNTLYKNYNNITVGEYNTLLSNYKNMTLEELNNLTSNQMEALDLPMRRDQVIHILGLDDYYDWSKNSTFTMCNNVHLFAIELYFFGVKDLLEPIEDYITKIKESGEYKEYTYQLKQHTQATGYTLS